MRQPFMTVVAAASLWVAVLAPAWGADLAGSEWRPITIGETAWSGGDAFVRFEDEGRLAGNSGCNGFFGAYQVSGDALEIGPLASTRKACPEAIMAGETTLLDALGAVRGFHRDGTELTLTDEAGAPVADLVQTDWD